MGGGCISLLCPCSFAGNPVLVGDKRRVQNFKLGLKPNGKADFWEGSPNESPPPFQGAGRCEGGGGGWSPSSPGTPGHRQVPAALQGEKPLACELKGLVGRLLPAGSQESCPLRLWGTPRPPPCKEREHQVRVPLWLEDPWAQVGGGQEGPARERETAAPPHREKGDPHPKGGREPYGSCRTWCAAHTC